MREKLFLEELKQKGIVSNNYASDSILFDEVESLKASIVMQENSLIFFRKTEYSFNRAVVYTTKNSTDLNLDCKQTTLEFIRQKKDNLEENILNQWAVRNGFSHFSTFNRMMMMRQNRENVLYKQIQNPTDEDLIEIKQFLEQNFNIFTERIPTIEELIVLKKTTYFVRENDEIVALLISEKKGVTEELRYWLVKENYRGKKYGGLLMKHFLNNFADTQRFILWVDNTNISAIDKYKYFGFKGDRIVNEIYLTKDLL